MKQSEHLGINLYSGLCGLASVCATFITNLLHPLELIKTRLQSHDGKKSMNLVPKYRGVTHAFVDIYKTQGITGLYKGFFVSFVCQTAAHALFFVVYQKRLVNYKKSKNLKHMEAVGMASLEGALAACLISQPLWVVKTRMLLNIEKTISEKENFVKSVRQIYQQYGWKGYLRGLGISVLLCSNVFIQMYTYEFSKHILRKFGNKNTYGIESLPCGAIAKLFSVILTHPLTTIRTRVQQNQYVSQGNKPKYGTEVDVCSRIWRQQGIRGFYKGMQANLMKGIPQRAIYFYLYEQFKYLFRVNRYY